MSDIKLQKFLADYKIINELNELVNDCKKCLKIINPWIHPDTHLMNYIIDRLKDGIEVVVIARPPDGRDEQESLKKLSENGANIYVCKYLHAKTIIIDDLIVIVGSMNFQRTGMIRNHETAIVSNDQQLVIDALDYFTYLLERSDNDWEKHRKYFETNRTNEDIHGFCIVCHGNIDFNKKVPVCSTCFTNYKVKKSKTVKIQYCHKCGNQANVTYQLPLCISCIK
ncbi:MAG: hypothetical protein GPJ52_11645 [Candidatus Heimdallarchaeota archaeon]|nr:hypothetical protein [Candidatus Heimdallarchaeota archaeon]